MRILKGKLGVKLIGSPNLDTGEGRRYEGGLWRENQIRTLSKKAKAYICLRVRGRKKKSAMVLQFFFLGEKLLVLIH